MDKLLIVEPKELTIWFELGKKVHSELRMRNVMHTMPVAFKVQTTATKMLTLKPAIGIIPPLGSVAVDVVMHSQRTLPESGFPISDDKVVVKSVVVPGGLSSHQSVSHDWFIPGRKQVFTDGKLRVIFVGGTILRSLISHGMNSKQAMEEAREVLERDVDGVALNGRDEHGRTPMHLAVAGGWPELVQVLLEFGANVASKNTQGQMVLHEAAIRGESLIVELLLDKGADPDAQNSRGSTALQLAITYGHAEVVRILLSKGARFTAEMASSCPDHAGPSLSKVLQAYHFERSLGR